MTANRSAKPQTNFCGAYTSNVKYKSSVGLNIRCVFSSRRIPRWGRMLPLFVCDWGRIKNSTSDYKKTRFFNTCENSLISWTEIK